MTDLQAQMQRLIGAPIRQVLDAGDHDNAVRAIQAGLGVGLIAHAGITTDLVQIPVSGNIPEWGLWCLTHPDFRHAARVNALMRFLADAMFQGAPPVSGARRAK